MLVHTLGFSAVLQTGGVLGPLDANVLNKFRVELFGVGASFPPVQNKLRDGLRDEVLGDAGPIHDLHSVSAGSPFIVQRGGGRAKGLGLVLLVTPPKTDDVLPELVFPGMAGFTPLAPVKGEIFQLLQGELPRYAVVQAHQLQQVVAG